MKKNLLLGILLVFLIVMNAVWLFIFFKKPSRKAAPPHKFIVKELQFSETQMAEYRILQGEFEDAMHPLHKRHKDLKEVLFAAITEEGSNAKKIDSITSLIGQNEKDRDMHVYAHFRAIYELCDESQRKRFKRIVNDAMRRGPRRGPGPPGPH